MKKGMKIKLRNMRQPRTAQRLIYSRVAGYHDGRPILPGALVGYAMYYHY